MASRLRISAIAAVLGLALAGTGCYTNSYESYYVDSGCSACLAQTEEGQPVALRMVTTEEDVLNLIEDGYVQIGSSSFLSQYCPLSCAVDTAKMHGASLVLLDIRFREAKQYTSVMYLPSYSRTYHSGIVEPAYGRRRGGLYSGVSSSTTMTPVAVQKSLDMFDHDAMFFRKIDLAKTYGINWLVPKRLPTEAADSSVVVRVLAVVRGSRAEKDGIRRGQVLKAINGKPIKTRRDLAPFLADETLIRNVEVEDAH